MLEQEKFMTDSDCFLFKKQSVLQRILCTLGFVAIICLMCGGLWGICYFEDLTKSVISMELKGLLLGGCALGMQLIAVVVWDYFFPRLYPYYDNMVLSLVFFLAFILVGIITFIVFLKVSVCFWFEDLFSARAWVPAFGILMFGSFCYKITEPDY